MNELLELITVLKTELDEGAVARERTVGALVMIERQLAGVAVAVRDAINTATGLDAYGIPTSGGGEEL